MYNYNIKTLNKNLETQIKNKINGKAKPIGALGLLEEIALQIALIQNSETPSLKNATIVVFAADHGIADLNLVNPYPKQVTALMVNNFVNGGAAICVFCKQNNLNLKIVDAGVDFDFEQNLPLIDAKIANGTKNYLIENAITKTELEDCFTKANKIVEDIFNANCNTIGFGEMGISNTSSAALIMSAITGIDIEDCVGAGTGVDHEKLKIKIETLEKVFEKHKANLNTPLQILECFGGFEIVMLTAAYLKAAELQMTILVDGFICTAALLMAHKVNPLVLNYCIFSHTSNEQAHKKMLDYLGVQALLNLNMRLGEGTGAAMAYPLVKNAVAFVNDMAEL